MDGINTPSPDADGYTTVRVTNATRDAINALPGKSANDAITNLIMQPETFQAPTVKAGNNTKREEGVVFIGSSGTVYSSPTIDADKIVQFLDNPYLRSALNSYMNIMFPAPVEVEVVDAEGEVDEDLTEQFRQHTDKPTIRINELIKKTFLQRYCFGSGIINPVWKRTGNEVIPENFRVLPSSSFDTLPDGVDDVYSSIMQGVILNDKGEVEVWQRQSATDWQPKQITNFFMVKDPMDEGLAGDSRLVPLIAILDMLKYAWNTEMQSANRAGSPVLFIKVSEPKKANANNGGVSDVDYANAILKNWSKNKQYQLRENMEIVEIKGNNTKNILETIAVLEQVINDYFSPTKLISKDGSHPLGSSGPELQLLNQAIQSEHRWLEDQFEQLLNRYFLYNAYPEGYRVKLHIPILEPDQGELNIKKVQIGIKGQALDLDDIRELLGMEAADDEKRAKIAEFWQSQVSQQPAMFQEVKNKTHPYVKAIEEGEEAIDKELHESIDKAGDKIMEVLKEAEQ